MGEGSEVASEGVGRRRVGIINGRGGYIHAKFFVYQQDPSDAMNAPGPRGSNVK